MDKLKLRTYNKMNPYQRVMIKVYELGDCLIYYGYLNQYGYGRLRANGKKSLAHRVVYEYLTKSIIPEGKIICHRCDNPACVNIEHLFIGTHQDNIQDCISKGRHRGHLNSPFVKGNQYARKN